VFIEIMKGNPAFFEPPPWFCVIVGFVLKDECPPRVLNARLFDIVDGLLYTIEYILIFRKGIKRFQ
jgi:hypothetical protein